MPESIKILKRALSKEIPGPTDSSELSLDKSESDKRNAKLIDHNTVKTISSAFLNDDELHFMAKLRRNEALTNYYFVLKD